MKTVCETNKCNGCMACVSACPKKCIDIEDSLFSLNAVVNRSNCINCKICEKVCPNINRITKSKPIEWKQGWTNWSTRKNSTSGGAATAIIKSFISSGGFVAACLFKEGEFVFEITNDEKFAQKFSGSKYVKSNPIGIYKKIAAQLKFSKVLFIGLPCQVAGLKNYIKDQQNLYTIDLICHGTPSSKLLNQFLQEQGLEPKILTDIKFRTKTDMGLCVNGKKINLPRVTDEYLCAFLEGINYTENCYSCQFAGLERVADITLGDSWGSEYENEMPNGISLILVQSEKGQELMYMSDIDLKDVDLNTAVANNHQLSHPTKLTNKRQIFINNINKGKSFKISVFRTLPKMFFKQRLKKILVILHLIK